MLGAHDAMVLHSFTQCFCCRHLVLYLMHMHLRCHVPGTTNMCLMNDVVYLEGRAYLTMKAQLITTVYGNPLRMLTVNFVPHKMSYNVAIYLELTWQYPLSEFLAKQALFL